MHILIFGASGHVGTGLAEHLRGRHDITGIVRSRPEAETPYRPLVVPDWVDDPEAVLSALAATDDGRGEGGPVDAVIAAIGGWYIDVPVLERGLANFDSDYASYLRGHFTASVISQRLAEKRATRADEQSGPARLSHVALNGVASVEALAGSGAISVFGAAQNMLIRVAAEESETVDFRELRIMAPIGGDDRNDLSGGVETITLAEVAAQVESIATSPGRFDVCTEISPE